MKERPILFSAPMVRAILAGTKTQTRRVVNGQEQWPTNTHHITFLSTRGTALAVDSNRTTWRPEIRCPYGQPGDRLWVREAWRTVAEMDDLPPHDLNTAHRIWFEANSPHQPGAGKLRPSMFMPRWASRITLEVTGVRVERLQEISIEDCKSEGAWGPDESIVGKVAKHFGIDILAANPYLAYRMLWESINGPGSWEANPWVWVVEFKRLEGGAA